MKKDMKNKKQYHARWRWGKTILCALALLGTGSAVSVVSADDTPQTDLVNVTCQLNVDKLDAASTAKFEKEIREALKSSEFSEDQIAIVIEKFRNGSNALNSEQDRVLSVNTDEKEPALSKTETEMQQCVAALKAEFEKNKKQTMADMKALKAEIQKAIEQVKVDRIATQNIESRYPDVIVAVEQARKEAEKVWENFREDRSTDLRDNPIIKFGWIQNDSEVNVAAEQARIETEKAWEKAKEDFARMQEQSEQLQKRVNKIQSQINSVWAQLTDKISEELKKRDISEETIAELLKQIRHGELNIEGPIDEKRQFKGITSGSVDKLLEKVESSDKVSSATAKHELNWDEIDAKVQEIKKAIKTGEISWEEGLDKLSKKGEVAQNTLNKNSIKMRIDAEGYLSIE